MLKRSWLNKPHPPKICKFCEVLLTPENKRKTERICKECARFRYKVLYYPLYKIYNRNHNQEIKKRVLIHYYGTDPPKCCHCGYADIRALTIDHIHGEGNKHRRSLTHKNFYNWLIKNKYPKGYQVLCMNCQFIKKWENEEWSKGGKYK